MNNYGRMMEELDDAIRPIEDWAKKYADANPFKDITCVAINLLHFILERLMNLELRNENSPGRCG